MRADEVHRLMVRDLLRDHLSHNPRTAQLYATDAGFHAAVEAMMATLVAVVETLRAEGNPPHVAAVLVRATLPRLLSDELTDAHDPVRVLAAQLGRGRVVSRPDPSTGGAWPW